MLQLVSKEPTRRRKPASTSRSAATSSGTERKDGVSSASSLWLDRYAPHMSSDLAMHKPKVDSIREWIVNAINVHQDEGDSPGFCPHVLLLSGNSGACKSTAVELVCKESMIHIVTWSEEGQLKESNPRYSSSSGYASYSQYGSTHAEETNAIEEYVLRTAYPMLQFSSTKISSSAVKQEAARKNEKPSFSKPTQASKAGHIVLMHDPPIHVDQMSKGSLSETISRFFASFHCPVVVILSDTAGRDGAHFSAERCIPSSARHRVNVTTTYCGPITAKRTATVLKKILDKERKKCPQEVVDDIATASMGDLRQAINQLQIIVSVDDKHGVGARPFTVSQSQQIQTSVLISSGDAKQIARKKENTDTNRSKKMKRAKLDQEGRYAGQQRKSEAKSSIMKTISDSDSSDNNARSGGVIDLLSDSDSDFESPQRAIPNSQTEKRATQVQRAAIQIPVGAIQGARVIGTTDESYSSLYGVAKLLNAALDADGKLSFDSDTVFKRCDFSPDTLLDFMQGNAITSIAESLRIANFGSGVGADDMANTDMDRIHQLLHSFSDVEMMRYRRYDASAHIDRSDTFFPDEYVCALGSRAGCAARGPGAKERIQAGKERGAKHIFQPVRRPKIFDLRRAKMANKNTITCLRDELGLMSLSRCDASEDTQEASGVSANTMRIYTEEVITSFVPYLRIMMSSSPGSGQNPIDSTVRDYCGLVPPHISYLISRIVMDPAQVDASGGRPDTHAVGGSSTPPLLHTQELASMEDIEEFLDD